MSQNNYNQSKQEFEQFRDKLYQSFDHRKDTVMDVESFVSSRSGQ